MSIQHLILGALMHKPDYGYNLKNSFFSRVGAEFGLNDGQLYPALKKMEENGLINREIEFMEMGPNRHTSHITKKGREQFLEWLSDSEGEERSYRYEDIRKDAFMNRCMYFNFLPAEDAREKIVKQVESVKHTIDDLKRARDNMTQIGVSPVRVKIVEYSIMTQETRLEWLRELDDLIDKGEEK